jgi:cathepsin E
MVALLLLSFVTFVAATTVSVPFSKQILQDDLRGIADRDRARARHLMARTAATQNEKRSGSVPAANIEVAYVVSIGVGQPPTQYDLLVDTGSSNTWVGANTPYHPTSGSIDTGFQVNVSYGSGSFNGEEYLDAVTMSSSLVIEKQSIGTATSSMGFQGVDGILGIGPTDLTEETLELAGIALPLEISTVTDNLFYQGKISQDLVSVSFEPTNFDVSSPPVNGELTFGGLDSSKYTGTVTYAPVTNQSPASMYWGIAQTVSYGAESLITSTGIVDTGTTLILLGTSAFQKYQSATGSTLDAATGLLVLPTGETGFNKLGNLNFLIEGRTFALTPDAQLWPRALNTAIGGIESAYYLVVNDLGANPGLGSFGFINGQTFLERFYSVYDTGNRRVGFATTQLTNAVINQNE